MPNQSDEHARSILPPPDPSFEGEIDGALVDSKGDWREPLKAPEGAPNVLLIMGDDIGYGHMSAFGGPANTPTFDRLAKRGLSFTNFHTTAVCSVARCVAHRAQRSSRRDGLHPGGRGRVPAIQHLSPAQRRDRVRDPAAERVRRGVARGRGRAWCAGSARRRRSCPSVVNSKWRRCCFSARGNGLWDRPAHGRAPARRRDDLELTADRADAVAHSDQTVAVAPLRVVDSHPIITDREMDSIPVTTDGHANAYVGCPRA